MYLNCGVLECFPLLLIYYLQDIFHSTSHWLQDCGIYRKIAEPYLNAEALLPLPKVRYNEPLGPDQLIMLWLIWACGIALGTLLFLAELTASRSGGRRKGEREGRVRGKEGGACLRGHKNAERSSSSVNLRISSRATTTLKETQTFN